MHGVEIIVLSILIVSNLVLMVFLIYLLKDTLKGINKVATENKNDKMNFRKPHHNKKLNIIQNNDELESIKERKLLERNDQ
jgi:hypothetical protein